MKYVHAPCYHHFKKKASEMYFILQFILFHPINFNANVFMYVYVYSGSYQRNYIYKPNIFRSFNVFVVISGERIICLSLIKQTIKMNYIITLYKNATKHL